MTPLQTAAYTAHSRSNSYKKRVYEAIDLIREYPDYASSISWGKDSVVLAHLAVKNGNGKLVHARYHNTFEQLSDIDFVRDRFISTYPPAKYVEPLVLGDWDAFEMAGEGFVDAVTAKQRRAMRLTLKSFKDGLKQGAESVGCCGSFNGMRAAESSTRRLNFLSRGSAYTTKSGLNMASPLMRWSGRDVWAYIVSHELPYLKIYDLPGRNREKVRSDLEFSASGWGGMLHAQGIWQDWQEAYPHEFALWMDRFPELKAMNV